MSLLPAVDLRQKIEQVYHQSTTNACGPHAVVNALEILFERAGQDRRFSRSWLWWWALKHQGNAGADTGTNFVDLADALLSHGAALEAQWPWSKARQQPTFQAAGWTGTVARKAVTTLDAFKRLMCLGVPIVFAFAVTDGLNKLAGNKNWRTHDYDPFTPWTGLNHWVAAVGYDDACGRVLFENSYGPGWGDGGFFGVRYEQLFSRYVDAFYIEVPGLQLNPVEGYVSIPYLLDSADTSNFALAMKPKLKAMLVQAEANGGIPAVIRTCVEWGISDKHLEHLMHWERWTVKKFKDDYPGFDWTGFIWASL